MSAGRFFGPEIRICSERALTKTGARRYALALHHLVQGRK